MAHCVWHIMYGTCPAWSMPCISPTPTRAGSSIFRACVTSQLTRHSTAHSALGQGAARLHARLGCLVVHTMFAHCTPPYPYPCPAWNTMPPKKSMPKPPIWYGSRGQTLAWHLGGHGQAMCSTMHPTPYTLHPTPYTLHPHPTPTPYTTPCNCTHYKLSHMQTHTMPRLTGVQLVHAHRGLNIVDDFRDHLILLGWGMVHTMALYREGTSQGSIP